MRELRAVNRYFYKYKNTLILGVIITIVAQIFLVISPRFVGDSVNVLNDFLSNDASFDVAKAALIRYFFMIVGVTLVSGFFTFLMRQTLVVMSRNIEFDMKNEVFQQYERLSTHFFKMQRIGDLMSRISEDVGKVRMYVGPAVMYSINTVVRMTVVLVQMFSISVELSLYALIPVPFLMIAMIRIVAIVKRRSLEYQQALADLSSFAQESYSGVRVVKAYALEEQFAQKYDDLTRHSKFVFMKRTWASSTIGPLMIGLIGLGNLIVLYIGAEMYMDGRIEQVGTIAEFIMYINLLTWPIASFGWISGGR